MKPSPSSGSAMQGRMAVRAGLGEKLIVPLNMRDGSAICIGRGNREFNSSSPHGAGRIMSRKKAKANLSLE